jgi:hypothetical protein
MYTDINKPIRQKGLHYRVSLGYESCDGSEHYVIRRGGQGGTREWRLMTYNEPMKQVFIADSLVVVWHFMAQKLTGYVMG